MVAKISIGSSLYGALAYNSEKINREEGRLLGANKIILPADGKSTSVVLPKISESSCR